MKGKFDMRRMFFGLLAVAVAAFTGNVARADAFEDILKKGTVRIATPLDVPPFGSQNAQREPEGFDVELAGMVAKALGVKLEMQQVTGANRIPFLLTNKVDIVISVMGLTPERAKQIMFTSPYADTQLAVFGPKSANVKSATEIGNLKVAAAKGTTQELALSAMNPKATIIPDLQKRNPAKEFELKFTIRRSPAHMGVRMGETNLLRWLDSFIFFNMMNGEIERLHQKWL